MRTSRAAAAASVLLASLIGPTSAQTCYSGVNVFTARGTGEVPPDGLGIEGVHIKAILAAIPNSNATVIDYPASFDNNSVPIGVQNGTRQVEAYLDACPTSKIVIMGYSQGALTQGYVLTGTSLGIGPDGTAQNYTVPPLATKYADQIVAIVFFGDPFFNINIGINSDTPYPCNVSSGGPRTGTLWESYGPRLEEWCNYSDFVCCATGTTFAGHVSYFGDGNGTITANFVSAKYNAAVGGGGSSNTTTPYPSTGVPPKTSVSRIGTASSSAPGSQSPPNTRPATTVPPASTSPPSGTAPGTTLVTSTSGASKTRGRPYPPLPTFSLPWFASRILPSITLPAIRVPTEWPR